MVVLDLYLGSDWKNGFEFVEELRVRWLIKFIMVFILISVDSVRFVVFGFIECCLDDYFIKFFF